MTSPTVAQSDVGVVMMRTRLSGDALGASGKASRPSGGPMSGSLAEALQGLRLKVSSDTQDELTAVLASLDDIISTPMVTNVSDDVIDSEEEAKMWSCFAQVYSREMDLYKQATGKVASLDRKRQVFADILFWAEVMRPGYDKQAAKFFTGNHNHDVGFQRIGKQLAATKSAMGITAL